MYRFIDNQKLQEFANYLYNSEKEDRDFTFVVEGKDVTCHKLIVKHVSDKMREKFEDWESKKLTKVPLDSGVTHKVFIRVLQYMYTGLLNFRGFDFEDALKLLSICNEFGLLELTKEISSSVERRDFLNVWSVVSFYKMAEEYHLQDLLDTCLKFVDTHAFEVMNNSSFVDLDAKLLIPLLHRDTLYAKEVEIFKAVKNWLDVNQVDEETKKTILSTVRINLISKSEFEDLLLPTGFFTQEVYSAAVAEKRFSERVDSTRSNY